MVLFLLCILVQPNDAIFGGAVKALTGSRTRPPPCHRDVGGAFLRSRSTACLTGSFWLGHSRVSPLGQGGNISANSGDVKKQNRL